MSHKLKDVVCSMEVDSNSFAYDYMGTRYAFCSAQCRERFLTHPHLYVGHPGDPAPKQQGRVVLTQRVFKLDAALGPAQAHTLINHVHALMGVESVDVRGAKVVVGYDLLQVTAEQIEAAFEAAKAHLADGWAARLRRGFVHYSEECEIGHLQATRRSSCH